MIASTPSALRRRRRRTALVAGLVALASGGFALGNVVAAATASAVPVLTPPPDPIGPGEVVNTPVAIINNGDTTAPAGTTRMSWVTSNLWAGFTVTGTENNCTISTYRSTKTAVCSYPSLAPGASYTAAIQTVTAPNPLPYGGVTFTITWGTVDGTGSATYNLRGSGPPDLSTALTVTPMPMVAGQTATASIIVDNFGYGDASGFVTRVALPTGTNDATASFGYGSATCTTVAETMDCATGAFPGGARLIMTVVFTAPPSVGASPLVATADPDNLIAETNEANNTQATPVNVTVAITQPDPVLPGQVASANLTATNNGATTSTAGTVQMQWPKSLPTGATVTLSGTVGGCTITSPRYKTYKLAKCQLPSIAPGATVPITTVNLASPTVSYPGVTVRVNVFGPTNTTSSVLVVRQIGPPDLSPSVSMSPNPAIPGQRVTATASMGNWGYEATGPFAARLELPPGAANIAVTAPVGVTCMVNGTTVDCDLAGLTAGGWSSMTVGFDAPSAGVHTATYSVDIGETVAETNEANNTASNSLTVNGAWANLTTSVLNPAAPVAQGASFTRRLTVTNIGGAEAQGVALTDLSPEFTYVSASGPAGTSCSAWYVTLRFNRKQYKGGKCSVGTVPAGGSVTVDVTYLVPTTRLAGSYTDTLTATTTSFRDPAMNAVSTGTTTVYVPTTPLPPTNTGLPIVTGTPVQGNSLATTNGVWSGASSYAYQWQRCDAAGGACVDIGGATTSSYLLGAGDVGSTLRSVVTATNAGGSASATSAASALISAPSSPVNTAPPALVPGEDWPGTWWGVTPGSWSGTLPINYAYQWQRCDLDGLNCVDIAGAVWSTYYLTVADVDHRIRARVSATNTGGTGVAFTGVSGEIGPGPG